ncbi:MAG: beta-lactamase family protein [Clostridiales bacterium]|nr:beta-lactamase family protein [Clostridiales bacterium]
MWNNVDRLLEEALKNEQFPGCAFAAGQGDRVLHTKTCGLLSRDSDQPVNADTCYDVGALTQVLVTTPLCLIAVEQGLLNPDDTIDRFLENVPQEKRHITIAQLLTQTSGLSPHFLLQEEARNRSDALTALLRHPLTGPVGGNVSDSGMGFLLLGFLLEKVFNMPLDEAVSKYVTAPLKLTRTDYLPTGANIAPTTIRDDNGVLAAGTTMDANARFLHGVAGHYGLFTSLNDMSRFASMLAMNGRIDGGVFLSRRAIHLAVTERTRGMNAARGYGFHITKRQNPFLGLIWPSDGYGLRDTASGSVIAVSPEDGFFAVILLNAMGSAAPAEVERLTRLLLNAAYAAFQRG